MAQHSLQGGWLRLPGNNTVVSFVRLRPSIPWWRDGCRVHYWKRACFSERRLALTTSCRDGL